MEDETYEKGESQSFWRDFLKVYDIDLRRHGAFFNIRAEFRGSTLANLYDPLTMPPALAKAHAALDRAVDRLSRKEPFETDADRVALLFDRSTVLLE